VETIENRLDADSRKAFEDVLLVMERSVPLEAIYADYSSSPQSFEEKAEISHEELKEKLENLYMLVSSSGSQDKNSFSRMVRGLKPFSENKDITQKILEELV